MIYAYTIFSLANTEQVCIESCYGTTDEVTIPASLCGLPVTRLADYAFALSKAEKADVLYAADGLDAARFSKRQPEYSIDNKQLNGKAGLAGFSMRQPKPGTGSADELFPGAPHEDSGRTGQLRLKPDSATLPPRIAGEALHALTLPVTLTHIGRYAFYNCLRLSRLSLSSRTDLGSGLFTGCDAITQLTVLVDEEHRSNLQELLLSFHGALLLHYYVNVKADNFAANRSAVLKYRLIFPQYYENAGENTPARITIRDLHGSGLFYRNCFADTQFQIVRYDQPFAHAEANEPEEITTELAFSRLLTPTTLSDQAAARYADYLHAHPGALAALLCRNYQNGAYPGTLVRTVFSDTRMSDEAFLDALIDACSAAKMPVPGLISLLMDVKRQSRAAQSRAASSAAGAPGEAGAVGAAGAAGAPVQKKRRFELL